MRGWRWLIPESEAGRRRRDRVLAVLLLLLCLYLVNRARRKPCGVLGRNQEFGAQFLERAPDPYYIPARGHRIHGPYPPSLALMAAPLSLVPTPVARVLWASLQGAALWVLFFTLRGWTRRWWPAVAPHAPPLYAAALLLVSRYLLRDTAGGGGNTLYLTLAVVGVDLHLRGRERLAGLPLGLGLVLKPNLALLLLPFALQRKWRTLGATLAAAAGFFLLPGLYYGLGAYLAVAGRWVQEVAAYAALNDLHNHALIADGMVQARFAMNQTLREAVHRLLRPPGDTGAAAVNPVVLSPWLAAWVARLLSLGLLVLAALGVRRRGSGRLFLLQVSALLPLCLLLSPITWKAHHVALLPFLFLVLVAAVERGGRPRWLPWTLGVYYVACNLLSQEVVGKAGKNLLQALSVVTWGALVLLGVGLYLVRREARERPPL